MEYCICITIFLFILPINFNCFNEDKFKTGINRNKYQPLLNYNNYLNASKIKLTSEVLYGSKNTSDQDKLVKELKSKFLNFGLDEHETGYFIFGGRAFLIYDCKTPSYTNSNHQKVILKNHIINHEMKRKTHPSYNDTEGYICNEKENIWRVNPDPRAGWNRNGFIGFADDVPSSETDKNFLILMDEKSIQDYFRRKKLKEEYIDYLIKLIFKIVHHPKYYQIHEKNSKPNYLDIFLEQDKVIPNWIKLERRKQMIKFYKKFTKESTVNNRKLETIMGDGFSFILFNCSQPQYIYPKLNNFNNLTLITIKSREFSYLFDKIGNCDSKENIWRMKKTKGYLTFDSKSFGLGFSPSFDLINYIDKANLCNEYFKFLMHPFYFTNNNKYYRKPPECSINRK